jgi:hypothetical protein
MSTSGTASVPMVFSFLRSCKHTHTLSHDSLHACNGGKLCELVAQHVRLLGEQEQEDAEGA